ncbi:MAG: hypothetical protein ACE5H9_15320 [Anaerolineae bacterium]
MLKLKLQPGDPAPDATLQTVDGQTISLADAWPDGQHILLVFLRHLG